MDDNSIEYHNNNRRRYMVEYRDFIPQVTSQVPENIFSEDSGPPLFIDQQRQRRPRGLPRGNIMAGRPNYGRAREIGDRYEIGPGRLQIGRPGPAAGGPCPAAAAAGGPGPAAGGPGPAAGGPAAPPPAQPAEVATGQPAPQLPAAEPQ